MQTGVRADGASRSGPRVSIVIVNFNYAHLLSKSIERALAQTWTNTEVIVVDDASTDASADVIRAFGLRIKPVLQSINGEEERNAKGTRRAGGVCDAEQWLTRP